ncbi:hypothetical protein [Photobacterium damselae]|uniref:hypothetical protein n=1 Tax=Photobacterium damselae TaxID=38293 RepID=UPI001EFCA30B|nr:hypothetical protein [Photobacterium damselae]MCG9705009.1 hypothetical protein [Photobacterium damselae]
MSQPLPCYTSENLESLAKSLAADLGHFSPLTAPAKNKHQRMWCVWWLRNNVQCWTNEMMEILLDNICVATTWVDVMDRLFPNNGITNNQKHFFRSTLNALLANAARKKDAVLPAHFRYEKTVKDEILASSPISSCYPKLALEIWVDVTDKSREKYKGMFTSRFDDLNIKKTSLTSQTATLSRYMICRGISSFDEMTVESFVDFRVEHYIFTPSAELSWKQVCQHFEKKGLLPNGWVQECIELYAIRRPKEVATYAMSTGEAVSNRSGYISNTFGEFQSLKQGAQNFELGATYKKGVKLLYAQNTSTDVVSFGEFKLSRKISEYAPDNLVVSDDNLWKTTQLAWTDLTDIEKNTAKTRINVLQYFNAYLFAYLPWFYQRHPNCFFDYPETPSKFLRSAFVKQDPVLHRAYLQEAKEQGKELIYPMSLLSFIEGMTSRALSGESSANQLRETCAGLRRYFEATMDRYGELEGLNLKHNPIPEMRNVGYKRSGKTKKDTFQIGYWVVFRMWLKELAKAAVFCSSTEIAKEASLERRLALELDRKKLLKIKGFERIDEITYSQNFDRYYIPTSIAIGGKELEIGEVKLPMWMRQRTRKMVVGEKSTTVDIANYQHLLTLTVSAYAGQRSSNGAHLCADTFDADYIPTNVEDPATTHVPLRVRTDKVRVQGLESCIQEDVMMLLCHAKEMRKNFSGTSFVEPKPYQNNEKSAKGKFRPLLQGSVTHSDIHPNMDAFVYMFEEWLNKHAIDFDTKITLTPSNLKVGQFELVKEHNLTELTKVMLCQYEDLDEPVAYSPLIPKTSLTPHSFRAQLVTVINITTGDEDAVKAMTGQTSGTIGYYTKASPEDAAALSILKDKMQSSNNVVSAEETLVTEDMLAQLFDPIEDDHNKDLPFFAVSGDALRAFKESGGRGLAINYTHICPYDNKCPEDVIAEHGRMNCHECSHACITSHNKVAIGAAARKALDEAKEYSAMLMLSTNNAEKTQLEAKCNEQIRIASHWLTKHSYIRQNPDKYIIAGARALEQYKYVPDDELSNSLLARLKEVSGSPSLQSQNLKRLASMVATKLRVKVQRQKVPELSQNTRMMLEFDPVKYVVQNLSMLAQLKGTDPETLLVETMKQETDVPLLEELELV